MRSSVLRDGNLEDIMRLAIMSVLLYGFMSFASLINADTVLSVGMGKSALDQVQKHPFERVLTAGYQFSNDDFFMRPMAGYYFTNGHGLSSAWLSYMFGVKAHSTTGVTVAIGVGPSYLFTPDDKLLAGHFQFTLEGCFGLSSLNSVSICYQHLSCAGIKQPNIGRDFFPMIQWIYNI